MLGNLFWKLPGCVISAAGRHSQDLWGKCKRGDMLQASVTSLTAPFSSGCSWESPRIPGSWRPRWSLLAAFSSASCPEPRILSDFQQISSSGSKLWRRKKCTNLDWERCPCCMKMLKPRLRQTLLETPSFWAQEGQFKNVQRGGAWVA